MPATHPELTARQREIYEFIVARLAAGRSPTVREIGDEFGIRSPNGVAATIKALKRKGFLAARSDGTTRSLEIPDAVHVLLAGDAARAVRAAADADGVSPSEWVEAAVRERLGGDDHE